MTISLDNLAKLTESNLYGDSLNFQGLSIDSRTLKKGETFLCLQGEYLDGHDYIKNAEQAGASSIVLSNKKETKLPYIYTKNTLEFLN